MSETEERARLVQLITAYRRFQVREKTVFSPIHLSNADVHRAGHRVSAMMIADSLLFPCVLPDTVEDAENYIAWLQEMLNPDHLRFEVHETPTIPMLKQGELLLAALEGLRQQGVIPIVTLQQMYRATLCPHCNPDRIGLDRISALRSAPQ